MAVQYEVSICFSWLALTTKRSTLLSDERTSISSSNRQSPLLSGIGRKFFKFFARGALPPSMTFLTGLNAFVCRFPVSDWLSLLCICQKPHRFADKLSEAAREPVCSACLATFCYFIQVIKRWSLVNVDGNVKIQFSLIFSFTFNLSLTNSQLSLSIF